jgi:uncharacterized membrane protein
MHFFRIMKNGAIGADRAGPNPAQVLLAAGALIWCLGMAAAPILAEFHSHPAAAALARKFYEPVCHQDPERSFRLFGIPLSVCQRCSSIYVLFAAVVAIWPVLPQVRQGRTMPGSYCALFLAPMLLDYSLDVAGIFSNSGVTRAVSGAMAGTGLGIYVAQAAAEIPSRAGFHRRTNHPIEESRI